nr:unnamed protein product [Haemonchus contortus]
MNTLAQLRFDKERIKDAYGSIAEHFHATIRDESPSKKEVHVMDYNRRLPGSHNSYIIEQFNSHHYDSTINTKFYGAPSNINFY